MTEVINSISDFEKYLKNTKKVVEEALDFSLGPENPEILRESMRYSLLAGGKRIRPILCLASCSLAGGEPSLAVPTAVGTANEGSPPASEQDAKHKIGRILFPPAKREYLIDSLSISGFSGPREKSSASSTTFFVFLRYLSKSEILFITSVIF